MKRSLIVGGSITLMLVLISASFPSGVCINRVNNDNLVYILYMKGLKNYNQIGSLSPLSFQKTGIQLFNGLSWVPGTFVLWFLVYIAALIMGEYFNWPRS